MKISTPQLILLTMMFFASALAAAEGQPLKNSVKKSYEVNKGNFSSTHQKQLDDFFTKNGDFESKTISSRKIKDGSGQWGQQIILQGAGTTKSLFFLNKGQQKIVRSENRSIVWDSEKDINQLAEELFSKNKREKKNHEILLREFAFPSIEDWKKLSPKDRQALGLKTLDLISATEKLQLHYEMKKRAKNSLHWILKTQEAFAESEDGPSVQIALNSSQCVIAANAMAKIPDQPCGTVQDSEGNLMLDARLTANCADKTQINCNPAIFGKNNTMCFSPPTRERVMLLWTQEAATPDTTSQCKEKFLKSNPELMNREFLETVEVFPYLKEAAEQARNAFVLSGCNKWTDVKYSFDKDTEVRNLARECSGLQNLMIELNTSRCNEDFMDPMLPKNSEEAKLRAQDAFPPDCSGINSCPHKSRYWRLTHRGRLSVLTGPVAKRDRKRNIVNVKDLGLEDFVPDSSGKAKAVFSSIPVCQAAFEMLVAKHIRIQELISAAVQESPEIQPQKYFDVPLPRAKPTPDLGMKPIVEESDYQDPREAYDPTKIQKRESPKSSARSKIQDPDDAYVPENGITSCPRGAKYTIDSKGNPYCAKLPALAPTSKPTRGAE